MHLPTTSASCSGPTGAHIDLSGKQYCTGKFNSAATSNTADATPRLIFCVNSKTSALGALEPHPPPPPSRSMAHAPPARVVPVHSEQTFRE